MIFDFVTNAIFKKVLKGTLPVGDSNKLDGKSAELYALISQLFSSASSYENLDFNDALNTKIYGGSDIPGNAGATNYPVNTTGLLIVFDSGITVYQTYITHEGTIFSRARYMGFDYWSKWEQTATIADLANKLDKAGGTVGDNSTIVPFKVRNSSDYAMTEYLINDISKGGLGFSEDGHPVAMYSGIDIFKILTERNVADHAATVESGLFDLTFADSSGNTVFTIPNCYYHKVGSHVFISGSKQNVTGAIAFNAGIKGAGLPFTPAVNGGTGEMVRVVACSADKPVAAAIKEGADITYNLQTGGIVASGTLESGKTLSVYGLYMTNA